MGATLLLGALPAVKVRNVIWVIERIVPDIERELAALPRGPRTSPWGLCADLGTAPSAEEID